MLDPCNDQCPYKYVVDLLAALMQELSTIHIVLQYKQITEKVKEIVQTLKIRLFQLWHINSLHLYQLIP